MKINFRITNITCEACVKLSKSALESLLGVKEIKIEKNGLAMIESDRNIAWEEIKIALAKVDKQAVLI